MKLSEMTIGHVYMTKERYGTERYVVFLATVETESGGRHTGGYRSTSKTKTTMAKVQRLEIRDMAELPAPADDDEDAVEAWYEAERSRSTVQRRMTGELRDIETMRGQEISHLYALSVEEAVKIFEENERLDEARRREREELLSRAEHTADKLAEYLPEDNHIAIDRLGSLVITLTVDQAEDLYKRLSGED